MKGSFRIAHLAGSEVRIHFSFLLLLGLCAVLAYQQGGAPAAAETLVYLLIVFLCVLLHEFGHALAARSFGIRTPDITLLPIGGLARLERIPASPFQELVITVAGPAVNVAIAAGAFLFLGGRVIVHNFLSLETPDDGLLGAILRLNVILVVFNLIPAFPMDGGRIFRAILASQMNYTTATRIAARVGQGIAILFVLAGAIPWSGGSQFMLLFIGVFVFIGAQQELLYAQIRENVARRSIADIMTTRFETIGGAMRLADAPDLLLGHDQGVFPVVDDDLRFLSLVGRDDLLQAVREHPGDTPVSEIARQVQTVTPSTDPTEVLELMQRLSQPILPVVNSSGQIVGLVELSRMVQDDPHKRL